MRTLIGAFLFCKEKQEMKLVENSEVWGSKAIGSCLHSGFLPNKQSQFLWTTCVWPWGYISLELRCWFSFGHWEVLHSLIHCNTSSWPLDFLNFCNFLAYHKFSAVYLVKSKEITTGLMDDGYHYARIHKSSHRRLLLGNESLKTSAQKWQKGICLHRVLCRQYFWYCFHFRKKKKPDFGGLPKCTVKLKLHIQTVWILSSKYRGLMGKQSHFHSAFWETLQGIVNCQFFVTFSSFTAPQGNLTLEP